MSGKRPAMRRGEYDGAHDGAYDGLMSLGSEAFSAPLPPAQSEPPRVSARVRTGFYVLSAGVGFSLAAIGLAIAFQSVPTQKPAPSVAAVAPTASAAAVQRDLDPSAPSQVQEPNAPAVARALEGAGANAATAPPSQTAALVAPAESAAASAAAPPPTGATRPVSSSRAIASSRARHRREAAPAQLSREQVVAAMTRVQPAVAACFEGTHGSASASVTVIGRTGRVTTAKVDGQSGRIGSCIARVVRQASFPQFTAESLTVRYPFAH